MAEGPHLEGLRACGYTDFSASTAAETGEVNNRRPAVRGGRVVALDVDDQFAFDIDEAVDVTLTYARR